MSNLKFQTVVFVIGAAVGMFSYTATALEANWLYTEAGLKRQLLEYRINDLANICDALGEQRWDEQNKNFKVLHGWGNYKLRKDYAQDIMNSMALEKSIAKKVHMECATRLSAA